MTVLVAIETLLLVLLTLLVGGLLRSHAEILRRLGPDGERNDPPIPRPAARAAGDGASDLAGTSPAGDAVAIALTGDAPPTLVAFLSSGCATCQRLWADLRDGRPAEVPPSVRIVCVTHDADEEMPSRLLELAPAQHPVVMSSAAWEAFRVPAAPYFVYVERGAVRGEGSASGWTQIGSLLSDALADERAAGGERRAERIDDVLAAAGVGPGHASLYPSGTRPVEDRE